jgi:hypothetical protein
MMITGTNAIPIPVKHPREQPVSPVAFIAVENLLKLMAFGIIGRVLIIKEICYKVRRFRIMYVINNNQTPPMTLPQEAIDIAKQFAFYNYCAAAQRPNANFEDIETWPSSAQVAYYAIIGFIGGKEMHWPGEVPEFVKHIAGATEWAGKAKPVIDISQEIVMLFDPTRRHVLIPADMILRLSNALAKYKEVGK